MALVDCEAWEVKDTDPALLSTCRVRAAASERTPKKLGGAMEMPFGKYRGRLLKDVPIAYLHWLSKAPDTGRSTASGRRFKRMLRGYLHGDAV